MSYQKKKKRKQKKKRKVTYSLNRRMIADIQPDASHQSNEPKDSGNQQNSDALEGNLGALTDRRNLFENNEDPDPISGEHYADDKKHRN